MTLKNRKIGFTSRYYEPLRNLQSRLDSEKIFRIAIHSGSYKNELEPIQVSKNIILSIKEYFDANLFSPEERKLLLEELSPSIVYFGDNTIARLKRFVELLLLANEPEMVFEYEKTVEALKQINQLLSNEFSSYNFMTTPTIEPVVFISYTHDNEDHKGWVLQLATRLRLNGVNVILDQWNLKLGSDLASYMERGLSQSQRVICVCSETFVKKANNGIGGAGYEKQIMTAELIKDQNTNWVIPLIKNNQGEKKTPTFLSGRMYISFEESNLYESKYEELLRDILNEIVLPIPPIGKNPFQVVKEFAQQRFIPTSEKYVSPATKGIVTFDYSNNDGCYTIGQSELLFETSWSKASDTAIYILNDPNSINTVALVKDKADIKNISDARVYDHSSRVRAVYLDQIAILQNMNGFYAAVKVISIKDDTRGHENDELTFEYVIQTNGSPDFTSH